MITWMAGFNAGTFQRRECCDGSFKTRRLHRLDSILTTIESPGFLKIDAQGYELEILSR